ncbi:hypothetical protein E2C01_077566 [Portunus trituberculatus]|uniref:Uncharacterized protein n=1 Tax=Portunus trituberculatus TaxID=210409 RepID=A0A5B7IET2_PORTR|nr:hypothetical protein [Portunus trituberculatus]
MAKEKPSTPSVTGFPGGSVLSSVSSRLLTDPSDVSFIIDSEDEGNVDLDLPANEFYALVTGTQKELKWKTLHKELINKHPYFQNHNSEQIMCRFKYLRSQLAK